jgi:hypothetical protein
MGSKDSSGLLWIEGGNIHYQYPGGSWEVRTSELKIIGEHTDDLGPANDYFFVFLTTTFSYEASFYAEGSEHFLRMLSRELGVKLECGLVSSTTFNSRVMWPPKLEGQALFNFVPRARGRGPWSRVKDWVLPLVEYQLADEVKAELGLAA